MINKASWRIYTFLKLHSVKTREEENRGDFIMDVILKTGLEKMGSLCGLAGEMERVFQLEGPGWEKHTRW